MFLHFSRLAVFLLRLRRIGHISTSGPICATQVELSMYSFLFDYDLVALTPRFMRLFSDCAKFCNFGG